MTEPTLDALLVRYGPELAPYVQKHAGTLLRYESVDDLVQGIQTRVLESRSGFAFRGKPAFLSWLYALSHGYLTDRRRYWSALKRRPANLLRLTAGDSATTDPGVARERAVRRTGPSTFASRREQLALAVQALATLLPRDRDLVGWHSEGCTLNEMAERLGISYDATERARARALERFRKAFRLISG